MRWKSYGILGTVLIGAILIGSSSSAIAGTLYSDSFANLNDLTTTPTISMAVGPAPGGKSGNALKLYDASDGYVTLTPTVSSPFPNAVTMMFRYYIVVHNPGISGGFQAVYNYRPGEGLRVRDDGNFGDSWGNSFGVPWQLGTWYTIAQVLPESGNVDIYVKQGADAQITSADYAGTVPGSDARPMDHSVFFNYGGESYIADYTVNAGVDFTIVPEPATLMLLGTAGLFALRRQRA